MPKYIPSSIIFAAKIRAARGLLNWSQGELAERAGVSKPHRERHGGSPLLDYDSIE
jgi:predicted transcriptional regulator